MYIFVHVYTHLYVHICMLCTHIDMHSCLCVCMCLFRFVVESFRTSTERQIWSFGYMHVICQELVLDGPAGCLSAQIKIGPCYYVRVVDPVYSLLGMCLAI